MKTLKLLLAALLVFSVSACHVEIIDDAYVEDNTISLNELLMSYDLWYVDIRKTTGNGEVPFLQKAFTISFNFGTLTANNNLVGLGKTGNGLGIPVADYSTFGDFVEIAHDIDGVWELQVIQIDANTIKLYHAPSRTSYYLEGYMKYNFDYDFVFYNNLHYFLQEYEVWEKVYTSTFGAITEFDNENYLQFFSDGSQFVFRSSIDNPGTPINYLAWDYEGVYTLFDVPEDYTFKTLTLDYDFLGNDYFELYVINDNTIELYHPDSETVYRFKGRGYIQYLKSGKTEKKRIKHTNPVMNVEKKRQN